MERWYLSTEEVESLLDKLCVELGYCLPRQSRQQIVGNPPATVEAFVDAVLTAEGPEYPSNRIRRQLHDGIATFFEQVATAYFHRQELQ
jgi:hypothetical protein